MKAIIYARQSSGDEEQSESVEMQLAKCRELAKKEGLEIAGEFTDLNTSGRTYPTGAEALAAMDTAYQKWFESQSKNKKFRKGLGEAIAKVTAEKCGLVIYDLTRLYRPVTGSFLEAYISQMLSGTKIFAVSGGEIDLNGFAGGLVASLTNRINDDQLKKQKEKSNLELRKMRDEGIWIAGAPPFGYKYDKNTKSFLVDPIEGPLLPTIFQMAADGKPLNLICRWINERREGNCTNDTLKRILRRPHYIGKSTDTKGNLIDLKKGQFERYLIDKPVWLKVQNRLADTHTPKRAKKHLYPLTGYMFCGYCGKALKVAISPQKGADTVRFSCPGAAYDPLKKCHGARIKVSNFPPQRVGESRPLEVYDPDGLAGHWQRASARIETPAPAENDAMGIVDAVLPLLASACLTTISEADRPETVAEKIAGLKIELSELAKRRGAIVGMIAKGLVTEAEAERDLNSIKAKSTKIDGELAELEAREAKAGKMALQKAFARLEQLTKGTLDYADYRELLPKVIEKITVFKMAVEITLATGEKFRLRKNKLRNLMAMPPWSLKTHYYKDGTAKAKVTYFYNSVFGFGKVPVNDDERMILDNEFLQIVTVGIPRDNRGREIKDKD